MAAPRITLDDLGAYFAGPDDTLWKLVSYAAGPTATLERIAPPPTPAETILGHRHLVGGVVGAPIFDGFVRLVLDGGLGEQVAHCAYPGCRNEDVSSSATSEVGAMLSVARSSIIFTTTARTSSPARPTSAGSATTPART